jgi:hypothetical protein
MKLSRQAGVTLMELLIAVTLVSFLSVGILFSIRVALGAMEKTNNRFSQNHRITAVQRIVESQIGGIMPVTADCKGGGGGKFVFFSGKSDSLTLVSTYSLQESSRGYPHVLDYKIVPAPEGVRLIVNESVYPGPINAGFLCTGLPNGLPSFRETGANPQSFVLADKLAFCRFVYRRTMPAPELEQWMPAWTAADRLPSGIRIEMAPLHAEPARLQLMTINAPIHVTKWVLGPYADN